MSGSGPLGPLVSHSREGKIHLVAELSWSEQTVQTQISLLPGPEVIKLFFMLNSTEHEIVPAHKC